MKGNKFRPLGWGTPVEEKRDPPRSKLPMNISFFLFFSISISIFRGRLFKRMRSRLFFFFFFFFVLPVADLSVVCWWNVHRGEKTGSDSQQVEMILCSSLAVPHLPQSCLLSSPPSERVAQSAGSRGERDEEEEEVGGVG